MNQNALSVELIPVVQLVAKEIKDIHINKGWNRYTQGAEVGKQFHVCHLYNL